MKNIKYDIIVKWIYRDEAFILLHKILTKYSTIEFFLQ